MAVTSIVELFEGRNGSFSASDGRRYYRKFLVLTNNPLDGPQTVKTALGANYGDRYQPVGSTDNDQFCYLESLDAAQDEGDALGWIVTATYSWFDSLTAGGGPKANPLKFPIDVTWGWRNVQVPVQYDVNNKPVLNTANDPFDPPLMKDDARQIITIVRNEAFYNVVQAFNYRNAVNSDSFAGYNPQMCRMLPITAKNVFHQDIGWYAQVTYQVEINSPNGHRPFVLNIGMRKISQTTNQPIPILLNGIPISKPMLLTAAGFLAKPTDPPYFIQPQIYFELPFAIFGFDPIALLGQRSGFPPYAGSA
jgi:hypothetical protein